ncbi:MAG: hypothetical protein IT204_23490 [Fimbriimonadaceae bacterium]|nr:hypothetical protein [Fimbriimonadaceae bacterium]
MRQLRAVLWLLLTAGGGGRATAADPLPARRSLPAPADVDRDGLPDAWERRHRLDPADAADRNGTNLSALGYTNLELYLSELAGDPVRWR